MDSISSELLSGGKAKLYSFTQQTDSSDYVEMGSIELVQNHMNILVLATVWATRKPAGIKIFSGTTVYGIEENIDTGFVYLFCAFYPNPTDKTFTIAEKLTGEGIAKLGCLHFVV